MDLHMSRKMTRSVERAAPWALAMLLALSASVLAGCDEDVTGPSPALQEPASGVYVLEPGILCQAQHPPEGTAVIIHGDGFSPIPVFEGDDKYVVLPTVEFVQSSGLVAGEAGDNSEITFDGRSGGANSALLSWQNQQQMTINITDALAFGPGLYDVTITNLNGSADTAVGAFAVVPPPVITGQPQAVCVANGPASVTLTGTGFLDIDGALPSVQVDGADVTVTSVGACTELSVIAYSVRSCTEVTIEIPQQALTEPRDAAVVLTNPAPASCSDNSASVLHFVVPPTLTSVQPDRLCAEEEGTFVITGVNLEPSASVTIGGVSSSDVSVNAEGTELTVTLVASLPPGIYDVEVDNGGGCTTTLPQAITVEPTPIVFFVDPPVLYNGVTIDVTIYASGMTGPPTAVVIVDGSGTQTDITDFSTPDRANRIQATIPSGLPAGDYEVHVTNDIGCTGVLPGGVIITDTLNIPVLSIEPAFVSPTVATAVTIEASAPGAGESPFVSTPRAYLNPNPVSAGSKATAMRAVVFVNDTTLTAVVPGGLTPGQYDLIIVNPSGEVGQLTQGLTVTAGEPPVIDSVSPATFTAGSVDHPATVTGANFDTTGASVELTCLAADGTQSSFTGTIDNATATTLEVTLPTSQVGGGDVCIVTVTNGDGASFKYSAVSITTSSYNLAAWRTDNGLGFPPSMTEARRALGLVAGRPTNTSRYLYAIGGDSGTVASAKTSVEAASVDIFGDMELWAMQVHSLPAARSFAGYASVGRFIYLTGGHDGTAATNTVYRAQILDPLAGPEIIDLDVALGDGTAGMGGGTWFYRVAAHFPDTDASNPGGESLPGEVQVVQLPQRDELLALTVKWSNVLGADGYRVYRSPTADGSVDSLELVASLDGVDNTAWTDMGDATTGGTAPLGNGSLGVWHSAGTMTTTREGHASVIVPRPGSTTDYVIYAVGGRDASGAYLDSIEFATLTEAADGSQTVSAFAAATEVIAPARADFGLFVMTADHFKADPTPLLTGDRVAVFVGPGRTNGGVSNTFQVAEVQSSGELASFMAVTKTLNPSRYGYGAGASNSWIYLFGGGDANNPTAGGVSGSPVNNLADFPNNSFNSLGISMQESRIYMGTAQESAFYFVAGGWDGSAALNSVDQTVQ